MAAAFPIADGTMEAPGYPAAPGNRGNTLYLLYMLEEYVEYSPMLQGLDPGRA